MMVLSASGIFSILYFHDFQCFHCEHVYVLYQNSDKENLNNEL